MAAAKKAQDLDDYFESGALFAGDDARLTITRVQTGIPPLDDILGGGFAYGKNTLCVGPESTGKTLIGQYLVAAVQRDGKRALLVDTEMSFDPGWWTQAGVDVSNLWVTQPANGEQAVNLMVSALRHEPNLGVIVLDSIACLSPSIVQEKQSGEKTISPLATLVTDMYQKIMPISRGCAFFAVNQLRDNMNGFDDIFPGGKAQRFNSHVRLHTRRVEWLKERVVAGGPEERVGYVMEVHARKNKIGIPDGICQLPVRFGGALDIVGSYVDQAIEYAIIEVGGAYYSFGGRRILGKAACRKWFVEDAAAFEQLKLAVLSREG
jgi:recombination protein RecA